jgi:hypothetical protein
MTDQARQYIQDLFSIVGTDSILIITGSGEVRRLKCPFIEVCKIPTSNLIFCNPYSVSAVKMILRLEEVFIINGRANFIWYFAIVE